MSLAVLREILENQAKKKQPIGYTTVLSICRQRIDKELKDKQLFDLMRDLGTDCFNKGEPPLNALVISEAKDNPPIPLIGFYFWIWNQFSMFLKEDKISLKAKTKIYEIYRQQCFHYWDLRQQLEQ
jgi:hypothetical protein